MGIPMRLTKVMLAAFLGSMLALLSLSLWAFAGSAHAFAQTGATEMLGVAGADLSGELSAQTVEDGWDWSGPFYYRNGKRLTGLQEIDGKRYYFSSNGRMRYGDFEINGVTYYLNDDGSLSGAKMLDRYYYDNLKEMTSADAYDFSTFQWARSIVRDITNEGDSREDKLWKAFEWVVNKGYAIHQNFNPNEENWPATYACFHFEDSGGDCHSDGAAFAYLAAAIGYEADVCIDSWNSGYAPSHCWTMIGDVVYDPLFYEAKGSQYYGLTSGSYQTNPTARFRVPQFSSAHAPANAKTPADLLRAGYSGLTKLGDDLYYFKAGVPLKDKWKLIDGKHYYFGKNGKAAVGSVKVRGIYRVFNAKGQLFESAKKGLRLVKVAGVQYRVNKYGKAMKGWSKNKKQRFFANGQLVVGLVVHGGKFYAASKKGVFKPKRTAALRKASRANAPAARLYNLLGKPLSMHYSPNCEGKGSDGIWMYKRFIVTTIRPKGAKSVKNEAYKLKKGNKLSKAYEYVCSIEPR